jgi:hypothetical protein
LGIQGIADALRHIIFVIPGCAFLAQARKDDISVIGAAA